LDTNTAYIKGNTNRESSL